MSFARAFAHSGAAAVIASLWTVNDRSTAQIMDGFYKNLARGQSIATALKEAKLAHLSDPNVPPTLQSPYFWAALTMTGADKTLETKNTLKWLWGLGALLLLAWFIRLQGYKVAGLQGYKVAGLQGYRVAVKYRV